MRDPLLTTAEQRPESADSRGLAQPGSTLAASALAQGNSPQPHAGLVGVRGFVDGAARHLRTAAPCAAIVVIQIDQFGRLQADHGARCAEALAARLFAMSRTLLPGQAVLRISPHQIVAAVRELHRGALVARCKTLLAELPALSIRLGTVNVSAQVSLGAGLIELTEEAPAPERIEATLDLALGSALRMSLAGGGRYELLGGTPDESPETESGRLLARINRAIADDAFRLVYQPIVSLHGETQAHYEVFMRMVDSRGEDVRPDDFLRTAIEHGVAGKIDRWVILRALQALDSRRASGPTSLTVNVSANSLIDPDFPAWLNTVLREHRFPPESLVIQFTETDVMDRVRQGQAFAEALAALGCRTSLSRFGLHKDSCDRLKQIPVASVKLDGSLVERLSGEHAQRDAVLQLLARLKHLGHATIVPRVETAVMLAQLWQAGVSFVQGNYLQPPASEMTFDFHPID
jgi:EAL domain-containing protein (putative c-di-GMP-specific phosphodiesterase class I)